MTIIEIISRHLLSNRRLVVPTLGCFIVKGADEVLFSELLTQDDGVLRGLLTAEGLSELECAVQLDRFVFEVRHALEQSGSCPLNGFGVLSIGSRGEIVFKKSAEVAPVENVISEQELVPADSGDSDETEPEVLEQTLVEEPEPTPTPRSNISQRVVPELAADSVAKERNTPQEQQPESQSHCAEERRDARPPQRRRPQHSSHRRTTDRFMILAIVVLCLALAAIGYGYYCSRFSVSNDEAAMDALRYQVEATMDAPSSQN